MERYEQHAIVVVGGAPPAQALRRHLATGIVIAADSGYDNACSIGLDVDVLVGDLDSISEQGMAAAVARGVDVERHPADKDATDTELAINAAIRRGCSNIIGVFGGGDRVDHSLGTLGAFSSPRLSSLDVRLWWANDLVIVLRAGSTRQLDLPDGSLFSVLPIHGTATIERMTGPRYPLANTVLAPGSTLGLSNVAGGEPTVITVASGTVLVVVPSAIELPGGSL